MGMALSGLRIVDLTRILAGPFCTMVLADLGADVIKVERPGEGDDTRSWGPPFLKNANGDETVESSYFQSINRNKRSITVDISSTEGARLVRRLIANSDVLVENFKLGSLAKYGLAYDDLKAEFPSLVYCSITGFGQTGPYAGQAGYDFLAQALGGMMSLTGEPDGQPMKVGIGNADLMTGMFAAVSILAALRQKDASGEGQHIDISLLDSQVAWLTYEAQNYLVSGKEPKRVGNAHPNIYPYDTFKTADGYIVLTVGNDRQFVKFCYVAGVPELAADERYATNPQRVQNKAELDPYLRDILRKRGSQDWLDRLQPEHVPCSAVNSMAEVFCNEQVLARGMRVEMEHPATGSTLPMVGSPIKMSGSPTDYRYSAPILGEHTDQILTELLDLSLRDIADLRTRTVI